MQSFHVIFVISFKNYAIRLDQQGTALTLSVL